MGIKFGFVRQFDGLQESIDVYSVGNIGKMVNMVGVVGVVPEHLGHDT